MEERDINFDPSIVICKKCSGIVRYRGGGVYVCEDCGNEVLDDYGKVRQFLEKRGPSNILEISAGTGLDRSVVNKFLKEGRLEVSPYSTVELVCSRCGMPIRYGEYCSKCRPEVEERIARNHKRGVYNTLQDGIMGDQSRMRFLNNDDDKKKKK